MARLFTLGCCAMPTKLQSVPMKTILQTLVEVGNFELIEITGDDLLGQDSGAWPRVDCLIAFYSKGYPLEKVCEYVQRVNPVVLNDVKMQFVLRDRRAVYDYLVASDVPVATHFTIDHRDPHLANQFEEAEDYIVYKGRKLNKPFIEKPVDADNHNNYVYYPSNAGGGCKKLFRKLANRSSEYYSDISSIRRDGAYIYEEFLPTLGTDVKVYTVGRQYAHAEARKSPTLDGRVQRTVNGKEERYPVLLTNEEKLIAYKVVEAFKQTVCGFDILRTTSGRAVVCDVNGWSFVKGNPKYYSDCASIISSLFLHALRQRKTDQHLSAAHKIFSSHSNLLSLPARARPCSKCTSEESVATTAGSEVPAAARRGIDRHCSEMGGFRRVRHASKRPSWVLEEVNEDDLMMPSCAMESSAEDMLDEVDPETRADEDEEELQTIVVVMRHGDRSPKQKMKFITSHPLIISLFEQLSQGSQTNVKLKTKQDLLNFLQLVTRIMQDCDKPPSPTPLSVRGTSSTSAMDLAFTPAAPTTLRSDADRTTEQQHQHQDMAGSGAISLASISRMDQTSYTNEGLLRHDLTAHNSSTSSLVTFGEPRRRSTSATSDDSPPLVCGSSGELGDEYRMTEEEIICYGRVQLLLNTEDVEITRKVQLVIPKDQVKDCVAHQRPHSIMVVIKWGGDLTSSGLNSAEALGHRLREKLYPGEKDGLLRLHSTFRHDFKMYTSDEGRCQLTAASFTKGFLDLDGDLTPILIQMVCREAKGLELFYEGEYTQTVKECKQLIQEMVNTSMEPEEVCKKYFQTRFTHVRCPVCFPEEAGTSSPMTYETPAADEPSQGSLSPPAVMVWQNLLKEYHNALLKVGPFKKRLHRIHAAIADAVQKIDACLLDISQMKDDVMSPELKRTQKKLGSIRARWSLLQKGWYRKDGVFDATKIPEVYDNARYDVLHSHTFLHYADAHSDVKRVFNLAAPVGPLVSAMEFGITPDDRVEIGKKSVPKLIKKIHDDIVHQSYLKTAEPEEHHLQVSAGGAASSSSSDLCCPSCAATRARDSESACGSCGQAASEGAAEVDHDHVRLEKAEARRMGIKSPWRKVRSRYYAASASHVMSLLNVLTYGQFVSSGAKHQRHLSSEVSTATDSRRRTTETSQDGGGGEATLIPPLFVTVGDAPYLSHISIRVWRPKPLTRGSQLQDRRVELCWSGAGDEQPRSQIRCCALDLAGVLRQGYRHRNTQ